jgi:hypothetical protein
MATSKSKIDAWRGAVRMPLPLAQWLQHRADSNFRSLNAELVEMVRRAREEEIATSPAPLEPGSGQ